MGGDEFVLIFSGARQDDLDSRVDNLDRLIKRSCRELCGEEAVGLSVGIACYPENGGGPETLLSYADGEMYRVKRARKGADQPLKLVKVS
jgi:diguanylate cyclase (GGDEF)-like protein